MKASQKAGKKSAVCNLHKRYFYCLTYYVRNCFGVEVYSFFLSTFLYVLSSGFVVTVNFKNDSDA